MRQVNISRRYLMAGIAAAPTAFGSISASAEQACTIDEQSRNLLNDWPNLARYATDNERLIKSGSKSEVVFIGDSITQGWLDKRPDFFLPGRVCRGIGGQTSGQMVLRMMADVVALKPLIVHIMAGTNDIAGNTGPMTAQQTVDNIGAMVLLAKAHNIDVLVGSIPPAANFIWRPGLETADTISLLNQRLAQLARGCSSTFVDYTPALSDGMGGMRTGFAYDGVHPNATGYAAMESVLDPIIIRRSNNRCSGNSREGGVK